VAGVFLPIDTSRLNGDTSRLNGDPVRTSNNIRFDSTLSWCCLITCTAYGHSAEGDTDFPPRWRLIKTWFTKHCDQALRDLCLSDGKKVIQEFGRSATANI
jgi:hypothetical protein